METGMLVSLFHFATFGSLVDYYVMNTLSAWEKCEIFLPNKSDLIAEA